MTSSKPKGRDPKLKPWRKGKSQNANKKGSIKSQIRSKQRLMNKISDEDMKQKLKDDIHQLEIQMKCNKKKELERKLAVKYHQVKFFERQKLTRMEKKVLKKLNDAKADVDRKNVEKYNKQLEQICMDQLYVAYYPKDEKYIALFANNGVRIVDDEKTWNKRERIRQKIIHGIQSGEVDCTKSWVNIKVLRAKNFVVDMKNIVMDDEDVEKVRMIEKEQRFQHTSPLFETIETDDKDDDENQGGHDDIHDPSDKSRETDDGNDDDDMAEVVPTIGQSDISSSESSSSDSSSDSSSSDSDGSDSEDDNDDKVHVAKSKEHQNDDDDSEDDFLVDDAGKGDITEVFKHAKKEANYEKKGDKSQGWKTQKQQPHEWKRHHRTR